MVDVKDEYWMMIKEQPFITRFTCSIKAFAFSLLGNISIEALTGESSRWNKRLSENLLGSDRDSHSHQMEMTVFSQEADLW